MTEKELITGLQENKEEAFSFLYDRVYPSVQHYIIRNAGNKQDAEDIFQETTIVLLQKLRVGDILLTASLKTFFFSISRNLWLKKIRDTKKTVELSPMEEALFEEDPFIIQEYMEAEAKRIGWLRTLLDNLTNQCLVMLTKFYLTKDYSKSIYKELGYKNTHSFQNQKYKCLQKLKKAALNNPVHG